MIIDFFKNAMAANLFQVIDLATGEPLKVRHLFYADDDKAIYRTADLDADGHFLIRKKLPTRFADVTSGGFEEISWTEFSLPIRIEPYPGLSLFELLVARDLLVKFASCGP